MLNWADFSVLLMILAGPLSGVAAAHQQKAGIPALILFGIAGFAIAIGVGMVSSKWAYRILSSKTLSPALQCVGYMLVPMISLVLVMFVPALLVMWICPQQGR